MAESNATQVILTDDGIKIIKAQNTADNATGGVTDLNDPNLMNVIEKQTQASQYAGLTSQYKVVLARAKEANISTTALTTAYTNLNTFMGSVLADTTVASDIDRDTYKRLTDAYNVALSNIQTALNNSFNTDISNMQSSVSVASQAASSAVIVASQAAITGDNASQVASQAYSVATVAQSAGNNATSVANNASQAASGAVIAGSQATVNANKAVVVASQAQIAGENATSVANNATSIANSATSTADNAISQAQAVGSQASSEIAVQSTATAKAQSTADNAFSQAQAVGSQASADIVVQSTATAKAQSTADNAFSQAQAVGSQASADIVVQSTATAKAQSTADSAFSQAQAVGSQASADIVVQSTATAKAQSTADNAFSQAATAIDNGNATSQAVTDLKDGSKLTIADLENGLATKVANSEYASYKVQTASQISQMVSNSAFSAYQTQTADLIAQKVATSDFSAYQATTAKAISSKVESSDFNTYKTQTADLIDDKVSSSEYASDKTQTASEIADRVSNSAFSTYQTQTASQIASKVDNGDFSTYKTQTADLIASKVATKDFSAYQATTAKAISSKVESSDFNTYKTQTADLIDDKVSSSEYASDKTQTASQISQMVSNSAFSAYQTQTASQIAQTVSNSAFSAYQQTTADLIASKVATSDFSAYQATTAKSIESKVESSDFNTYKTQTADLIADKVSSSEYASDKTQTASEIADRVSNSAFSTYQTQTASQIASKVDNGAFSAYQSTTADLIASKVATKDFSAYQATTAKAISSKVESSDFNTYKTQTADEISSKVESSNFQALQTQVDNSAVGTNLLTNSNFSDESLADWVVDQGITTSFDSNGNLVLTVVNATANNRIYHSNQILDAGTTYAISFYAYVDSSSTSSIVNVEVGPYDNLTSIAVSGTTLTRYTGIINHVSGSGILTIAVGAFNSGTVGDVVHITKIKLEKGSLATDWSLNPEDQATQSDITQSINNIHLGFKNPDGSTFQMNLSADGVALLDFSKIILNGTTNISNGTIGTAQIADAAITNAKIANLAVGTAQIANGAITNAQIGSLAVGTAQIKDAAISSAKIANLAVGTAQIGDGAITNAKIDKLAVGTAQIANAAITDAQIGDVSANKLTAGTIDFNTITGKNINASNITTGKLSTDRLNVGTLSALSANLGNVTTGSLKGVDIVAKSFSTPNGSFTTDANGNVVASNLTIRGVTNLVYNSSLSGGNGSYIPGWSISNNGYCALNMLLDGVPSIGWNNSTGAGVWNIFAQTKLHPLNGATSIPFSASVWFLECGSDTSLQYQVTLAFFDSNGNRIDGGFIGNTWNGISSSQGWRYVTIDNAVIPKNATYVGLQYWSYNGKGNAYFSSPMLTQSSHSTGYQPDTGNVISAGEIDGSVINGSTINGTTFNAGTKLNQYGNTSYPLTINQDGSVTSTSFGNIANDPAALRTVIKDGSVKTNFRGMKQLSTGAYPAADVALGAGQLALLEGYSNSQDPNFTATGMKTTGYAILDASTGLSLHGTTQAINFSGTDQDQTTGITMNSYGNIIGYPNATWWRIVSNSGSNIANFGIDKGGSNVIQFNRELDVGNFQLNGGHTFTSADGGDIHFAKGKGGAVNIYAGEVHYNSLVKSSLLSVKKDVQRADTAYWAQLVNSIDLATYQYKSDDNTSHIRLSSIVDDVNDTKQWKLPDVFVSRDENGKLNGVDDSVLLNATLATVQEQQKQIDQLNGHLLELEAKLNG